MLLLGVGPANRRLDDLSCLIWQSYETKQELLVCVAKTNKETETDLHFTTLLFQLDSLTTKAKYLEVMSIKNERYIPPNKC